MDDVKRIYREGEQKTKEAVRELDGHDLTDDLGNAGDEVRKDIGNAGDDLRDTGDRAAHEVRGSRPLRVGATRRSIRERPAPPGWAFPFHRANHVRCRCNEVSAGSLTSVGSAT